MQFNFAQLFALAAVLSGAVSDACKCGGNVDATVACCKSVGGSANGDDCPANQISERLSNFASCCNNLGARSDCRCPVGCARKELDTARAAQGLPPATDKDVLNYVQEYDLA
ncbi:hypothetical protein QBC46DRAFT_412725 [Diplogelasinospora grovesii]|uniref:Uncharacterized protein n=1 Tax=Diplogelasinospora grovesii TaxID=303347 RepID=A0AAN6N035_9PEZI|nr:hypothetical protein QBC46DRAFT_412725 [Diplogelasinospora grovesii]